MLSCGDRDLEIPMGLGCGERDGYVEKQESKQEWLNKQVIKKKSVSANI